MVKVECGKCCGKGEIKMYRGIACGICFSCGGRGYNLRKSEPKAKHKYQISAVTKKTGERIRIYWIKSDSESRAIKKAKEKLNANNFDLETIEISGVM